MAKHKQMVGLYVIMIHKQIVGLYVIMIHKQIMRLPGVTMEGKEAGVVGAAGAAGGAGGAVEGLLAQMVSGVMVTVVVIQATWPQIICYQKGENFGLRIPFHCPGAHGHKVEGGQAPKVLDTAP